ncbi:MAG: hypothetical protein AB8I08_08185 [Sandaracinaceae bacterium]
MKWAALVLSFMVAPSTALAHPLVDEGRRLFNEAELERARDVLTQAEAEAELTREELAQLYETRALSHAALGDEEAAAADLGRLAMIAPEHELGPAMPPELREVFDAVVAEGPPRFEVRATATLEGERVVVRGALTPHELLRGVRLGARSAGEADFAVVDGAELVLEAATSPVTYFAQGLGPGGLVLAEAGSPEAPRSLAFSLEEDEQDGGGDDTLLFVGLGAAGGAVLTAIVIGVAVAAASGPDDTTQPLLPDL